MKKMIWIVLTVVVITITIGALILRSNTELRYRVLEYFFCPENNDLRGEVLEMEIYRISQDDLEWLDKYGSVYNTKIEPEIAEDILLNPEEYCVLEILYSQKNNSPSVVVDDLRLYPEFSSQEATESIVILIRN